MQATAVIVAAGSGSRMKMAENKLLLSIAGVPVLARTMRNYQDAQTIGRIIVVCKPAMRETVYKLAQTYRVDKFAGAVSGGETRVHSVLHGLSACKGDELVAIADGARPFTLPADIDRVTRAAAEHGGAILCARVTDTIKQTAHGSIVSTVPRDTLLAAQTPQTFRYAEYKALLTHTVQAGIRVTDDASVWEAAGKTVFPVIASGDNMKITTAADLPAAGAIARERERVAMRIGHGYDVHRLIEGRELILCGVKVPFEKGLLGHSDADVALHALMDALLGALALGDIGGHFPDSDPAYKGISSLKLLEKVYDLVQCKGYILANADMTILAQRPKLAAFIPAMRQTTADALRVSVEQISIKATTEEGLGFTGRGEGIAAHAAALVTRK